MIGKICFLGGKYACYKSSSRRIFSYRQRCQNNCIGYQGCRYSGDDFGCLEISGITSDSGNFPLEIYVNVYTNGLIDFGIIQIPVSNSTYDINGSYNVVSGYNINVGSGNSSNPINPISCNNYP